jgi:uncharacterized protein YjiS (DUF1127 family)
MTYVSASEKALGSGGSLPSVHGFLEKTWHTLLLWQRRHSGRRAVCDLDDRTLRDIGLTRADVAQECSTPFSMTSDFLPGTYGR